MMKKINILYLADGRQLGGGQKVTQELFEKVKEPPFRKYLVSLYNSNKEKNVFYEKLVAKGYNVISLRMRGLYDISCIPKLIRICRENEIQLIHTDSPRTDLVGLLAAKLMRVSIISTFHSSYAKTLKEKIYRLVQLRILYRFIDRVITVSKASRKFLTKSGVSSERIKVVYNGISAETIKGDISGIQLMKDSRTRQSHIVFIGSLIPGKGINYLINAMAQVIRKFKNIELLIVGDGPELKRLVNQAEKLDIGDSVHFNGYVNNPREYINLANFLVLPSISEELPLVLLEAMRESKAVIATKVGGIPEVVQDSETGTLVEPENSAQLAQAMLKLLQNPEKCKDMGKRSRKRLLQNFTVERMIKEVTSIYLDVIKATTY